MLAGGQARPTAAGVAIAELLPSKEGLFQDAEGNRLGFSGSVNESATALEDNYESFMVFNSWDGTAAHLAQMGHRSDRLWDAKERDWMLCQSPRQSSRSFWSLRPSTPPTEFDVDEPDDTTTPLPKPLVDADQRERIIFQFLRDVPHLLNADRLGVETCTVRPWPHPNHSGRHSRQAVSRAVHAVRRGRLGQNH